MVMANSRATFRMKIYIRDYRRNSSVTRVERILNLHTGLLYRGKYQFANYSRPSPAVNPIENFFPYKIATKSFLIIFALIVKREKAFLHSLSLSHDAQPWMEIPSVFPFPGKTILPFIRVFKRNNHQLSCRASEKKLSHKALTSITLDKTYPIPDGPFFRIHTVQKLRSTLIKTRTKKTPSIANK